MGWQDAPIVDDKKKPAWMSAPFSGDAAPESPSLVSQAVDAGKNYVGGIGNSLLALGQRTMDRSASIMKPTATAEAMGLKPGIIADIVGAPERLGRAFNQGAAELVDIGTTGFDVGSKMNPIAISQKIPGYLLNKATGSRLGQISGALGEAAAPLIGGVAQKYKDYKESLPESGQANLEGTVAGAEGLAGLAGMGAPGAAKAAGRKVFGKVDEALGQIAENRTALPEETLRLAGTKEGRQLLAENKGAAYKIGQEFVQNVYNPIDAFPEAQTVKAILPILPPVKPDNIINALQRQIKSNPPPKLVKTYESIAKDIEWVQNTADANGGVIPVDELLTMRQHVDDLIDGAFKQETPTYITALKQARHEIRMGLENAAVESGNPEYVTAMKGISNKLEILDRIKDRLGHDVQTGENRGESFIRNLMNKGNAKYREVLQDYDNVFGSNILERANSAHLADQLTKSGKLPLMSKWNTGAGGSLPVRMTLGSPALMSRALNVTGKLAGRGDVGAPPLVVGSVPRGTAYAETQAPQRPLGQLSRRGNLGEDPFQASLLTPKQYKELKGAREFNAQAGESPDYPEYNPEELKDYDTHMMDEAYNAGYRPPQSGQAVSGAMADQAKIEMRKKLGLAAGKDYRLEDLSPQKQMQVNAMAEKINKNPDEWNRLFKQGLLERPHSEYNVESTEMLSPDDILQWVNEAGSQSGKMAGIKGELKTFLKNNGLENQSGAINFNDTPPFLAAGGPRPNPNEIEDIVKNMSTPQLAKMMKELGLPIEELDRPAMEAAAKNNAVQIAKYLGLSAGVSGAGLTGLAAYQAGKK
jgi:hypothetical protein